MLNSLAANAATSDGLVTADMSSNTAEDLVNVLLGSPSTIQFSNAKFTGVSVAGGVFTGGSGIIGFNDGVVLSTGSIQNIVGPNAFEAVTKDNVQPGDSDLGAGTRDAASLEFDFVPDSDQIWFQYVFASDEYNEFANSNFNDTFAFLVNGQNKAFVPGTTTPVSINSINGGNPIGVNPKNPLYFVDNDDCHLNTEMDGLTTVLTVTTNVNRGTPNHVKLVIADMRDGNYDSVVLLMAGSFGVKPPTPPNTPPKTTAVPTPFPNSFGWNKSNVGITLHATTDVVGNTVKEIHYQAGQAPEVVVLGADASFLVSSAGITVVTYFAVDSQGNTEAPKTLTVQIDKTKPTIAGVYKKPNAYGWYNTELAVNFACQDTLSGIDQCLGNSLLREGANQRVVGTATDKAGNTTTTTITGINIDTTKPVTVTTVPTDWYKTTVTASLTATDNLSGVMSTYYILDGGAEQTGTSLTLIEDGTHTIRFWSADLAGNVEPEKTVTVRIDMTAPTITGAPDRPANSDGWYNASVSIPFICNDGESGVATCSETAVLSNEGKEQSVTGTGTDMAGNSSSTTVSGINIDLTAPVTTATAPSGWQRGPLTVTLAAMDNLSGTKHTYFTVDGGTAQTGNGATITAEGSHTLRYWSVDHAGNVEQKQSVTVQIDNGAPTITHTQIPAPNAYGWNNTDVAVKFTCHDTNGIASCAGDTTLTDEGQGQTVTGTAIDFAGNTATDTATVNIDKTSPELTYSGNLGTYAWDAQINITCIATDGLSGLATNSCKPITGLASSFGAGAHTYTAAATDYAGNTGTGSVTFTVTAPPEGTCALIDQWVPHHGVANSLCVKIRNAMAAQERGNYGAAFNLLEAFKHEVEAQADKHILPGGKEVLLEFANTLEADLPPIPPDDRDKKKNK